MNPPGNKKGVEIRPSGYGEPSPFWEAVAFLGGTLPTGWRPCHSCRRMNPPIHFATEGLCYDCQELPDLRDDAGAASRTPAKASNRRPSDPRQSQSCNRLSSSGLATGQAGDVGAGHSPPLWENGTPDAKNEVPEVFRFSPKSAAAPPALGTLTMVDRLLL